MKTDPLEIREVSNDDRLATPFEAPDGSEIRLGDRVISGGQANLLRVKQNDRGTYDLLISLTGAVQARWRRYASSRKTTEAALLVNGRVVSVFKPEVPDAGMNQEVYTLTVPDAAQDAEEADALNSVLDSVKKPVKAEDAEK